MAKTPFNATLGSGSTFTVPAGKVAIFQASRTEPTSTDMLLINGAQIARLVAQNGSEIQTSMAKPICAGAGSVLASGTGSGIALSGFLYDVTSGREAVNFSLSSADTYTVPAGKFAVLAAHQVASNGRPTVDGQSRGTFGSVNSSAMPEAIRPICVHAGGVVGVQDGTSPSRIGFSGFLYS